MAAVTLVVAPLSGRLVGNRGARVPLIIGSLGLLASAAILTQLTAATPYWLLIVTYLVFGLGFGVINPPITNTAVSGMPPSQAGVASAVASTSRQVGATLGVAVLGALAGASTAGGIGAGFAQATHVAWWIIVGLSLIVFVLALVTTTPWARATAAATAERFREDRPTQPPSESEAGRPELVTR
jgi:MFS family permease